MHSFLEIGILLFAYGDAVNESSGFSPFELIFGHEVRGPLKLLKEQLLQPQTKENMLQYVSKFRDVGDQVLVLIPQWTSSLGSSFSGLHSVLKKVGDRNYIVSTPNGKRKDRLCHVNLLKRYVSQASAPAVTCLAVSQVPEEISRDDGETVGFRLRNSRALQLLDSDLAL